MIKVCKENKLSVLNQVRKGKLDAIALSTTNLIDEIILTMHTNGILSSIHKSIPDYRAHNTTIPYDIIWALSIAAKMKIRTSLTDIPFAINDYRTLAKLGYSVIDVENGLKQGLMQEGSLRFLIGKYESKDLLQGYNTAIQNFIMPQLNIETNIHILDCTDLEVNYFNPHYEQSGISYSKRKTSNGKQNARGYKLSTLRGIVNDSGIIEEIRFGPLNIHDLTLSEEMLLTTKVFKPGDILISDRGFLSRKIINYLKTKRNVDVYIPLKKNMDIYNVAINVAKEQNKWSKHPLRRFSNQKICLVEDLGPYWLENDNTNNVDINGCVVWDETDNEYFVFATTDTSKTASSILLTYNVRSEIEEDYRQLKDFWKIEDFKSTKLNVISFHIVSVLFGYLFFQLYTLFLGGEQYAGKSLPVIMKNYINKAQGYVVIYVGEEFGVLKLIELMELYAQCSNSVKLKIKDTLI